jgi:2-iminobutanoate/2-iminopropanoate deaminase
MVPEFLMIAGAPSPVAPFSHAVRVGPWLIVTGQMPTWPDDDARPLPEGVTAQTQRVIANLRLVLEGAGMDWSHIVQARIYLTQFERDYAEMNETWRACFPADRLPARTCIGITALARSALVEIDLVAFRPETSAIQPA